MIMAMEMCKWDNGVIGVGMSLAKLEETLQWESKQ